MDTPSHSDTNFGYARAALRALAKNAARLPSEARVRFLQKLTKKELRIAQRRYMNAIAPVFECDERLGEWLRWHGASETALTAVGIWEGTIGSPDQRLETLLDSLTFSSSHQRISAQTKVETLLPLLEDLSDRGQTFTAARADLHIIDRARALLKHRNQIKSRAVSGRNVWPGEVLKLAIELSYWLPGLEWANDLS